MSTNCNTPDPTTPEWTCGPCARGQHGLCDRNWFLRCDCTHGVLAATAWQDRHGDIWTEGDDGLMHTPETEPFPREHVEKKWGPLVPVVRQNWPPPRPANAASTPASEGLTDDVPCPVLDVGPCGCHHPKIAGCDHDDWPKPGLLGRVKCSDTRWRTAFCIDGARGLEWVFADGARRRVDASTAMSLVADTELADAEAKARAEAWDEGYESAICDTEARSAPPGPNGPVDPTPNPYGGDA